MYNDQEMQLHYIFPLNNVSLSIPITHPHLKKVNIKLVNKKYQILVFKNSFVVLETIKTEQHDIQDSSGRM